MTYIQRHFIMTRSVYQYFSNMSDVNGDAVMLSFVSTHFKLKQLRTIFLLAL